jgi:hypothetical protein
MPLINIAVAPEGQDATANSHKNIRGSWLRGPATPLSKREIKEAIRRGTRYCRRAINPAPAPQVRYRIATRAKGAQPIRTRGSRRTSRAASSSKGDDSRGDGPPKPPYELTPHFDLWRARRPGATPYHTALIAFLFKDGDTWVEPSRFVVGSNPTRQQLATAWHAQWVLNSWIWGFKSFFECKKSPNDRQHPRQQNVWRYLRDGGAA